MIDDANGCDFLNLIRPSHELEQRIPEAQCLRCSTAGPGMEGQCTDFA